MACTKIQRPTRKAVIQSLLQPTDNRKMRTRPLAHQLLGGVLWAVMEETRKADGHTTRYLCCSLVFRGQAGWTSLTFTEINFSNIYTCPLAFLDQVPDAVNPTWRRHVREFQSLMSSPASSWAA